MNLPDIPPEESLITYPCDFPIKVMGKAHPEFMQAIVELTRGFDPDFDDAKVAQRSSSGGKYIGLTLMVRATSREQLDAIYRALTTHPMVAYVL